MGNTAIVNVAIVDAAITDAAILADRPATYNKGFAHKDFAAGYR
jgi:hypothetical protein